MPCWYQTDTPTKPYYHIPTMASDERHNSNSSRRERVPSAVSQPRHRDYSRRDDHDDDGDNEGIQLADLQQIIEDRNQNPSNVPLGRQALEDLKNKGNLDSSQQSQQDVQEEEDGLYNTAADDHFLMQLATIRSHGHPTTDYVIPKDTGSSTAKQPLQTERPTRRQLDTPDVVYDNRGRPTKPPTTISANSQIPGAYPGLPGAMDVRPFVMNNSGDNNVDDASGEDSGSNRTSQVEGGEGDHAEDHTSTPRNNMALGVSMIVIVIVISLAIAIPTAILTGDGNPTSETDQSGTDSYLVPNITNRTIAAMQDPTTSQHLAYNWISKDPFWDSYQDWRKIQRFGMSCLYYACMRHLFSRFKTKANALQGAWVTYHVDECSRHQSVFFQGECDTEGHYRRMSVEGYDHGEGKVGIPPEVFHLSRLEYISFLHVNLENENSMDHFLPVGSMMPFQETALQALRISNCKLSVILPTSLGQMTSLTLLDLSSNKLQSTVPTELGLLTRLETLLLQDNELSGTLPEELLELPSLKVLHVGALQIPDSFCEKKSLWDNLTITTNLCNNHNSCCCSQGIGEC
ncbi:Leucine Rich Repeat [Seminavis robusta]|uniref:Leucine Rich Repeat n=1 Tax=Seminavis robusta TaxID=568900 RepID=A0A9N8HJS1_9STRA|nr:Leucine Rich Repeat [Seminavis robusta]|eukprot:Sro682_g186480.1 Leucine Rich Repeat (573) ;mRNA; r:19923-21728